MTIHAPTFLALAVALVEPASRAREVEPPAGSRSVQWAMVGAGALDLASTEIGIARGLSEGNPLMRKRAVRLPLKVGLTVLVVVTVRELLRDGHPKLALALGIGAAAAWGYAAARNVRLIGRSQPQ